MRRLIRKIKVKTTKFWRNLHKDRAFPIDSTHQLSASIFRKALREKDAELILMPVANKRIIKLEKQGLYIVLQHSLLEITNHKYSYHIEINYELYNKLSKMFDQKLDIDLRKEEEVINNQLHGGLRKVFDLLNKK